MKKTIKIFLSGVMSLCIMGTAFAHGTGKDHKHTENETAIESAEIWLKFVDAQKYNASWQTAAQLFKNAVTSDQWEGTVRAVRAPLGKLIERHLFHDKFITTLPGMPDGEYVLLRFVTQYEHKQSAVESVTLMKDEYGNFRVAGYFIK